MTQQSSQSKESVTFFAFLICFFIVGVPFWSLPYNQVNLPNSFFGIGVFAVFLTSALLSFAFKFSTRRSFAVAAMVFPAVLMARVVVEANSEPGRHNLWPLALVIAAIMGILVAGAGALLGGMMGRVMR